MTNEEIKENLGRAVRRLLKNDADLIERDASERSITHKLAEYLQLEFPTFHVDCEYNRNFNAPKNLELNMEQLTERLREKYAKRIETLPAEKLLSVSTYPDIIVHLRKSNEFNLLIVEVKKTEDLEVRIDLDDQKLSQFTRADGNNPYHYQIGVAVTIETGLQELKKPALNWYINGTRVEGN